MATSSWKRKRSRRMRPKFSIDSMQSRANSFDGAFGSGCTRRWSLDLPEGVTEAGDAGIKIVGPQAVALRQGRWSISFEMQGTATTEHDFVTFAKRAACFVVLSHLPNQAL